MTASNPESITGTPATGTACNTKKHACACGQVHAEHSGTSHRDACTSPLKNTATCCCSTDRREIRAHHCCDLEQDCQ